MAFRHAWWFTTLCPIYDIARISSLDFPSSHRVYNDHLHRLSSDQLHLTSLSLGRLESASPYMIHDGGFPQ